MKLKEMIYLKQEGLLVTEKIMSESETNDLALMIEQAVNTVKNMQYNDDYSFIYCMEEETPLGFIEKGRLIYAGGDLITLIVGYNIFYMER